MCREMTIGLYLSSAFWAAMLLLIWAAHPAPNVCTLERAWVGSSACYDKSK